MIQRNSIWCGNIFQAFGFILFPCSNGCDPPHTSFCAVYSVTHIRAWRHVTAGNRASLEIYKAGDQSLIYSGCSVSLGFCSPTLFSLLSIRIHLIKCQPVQRTWQWCIPIFFKIFSLKYRSIICAIFLEALSYIFSCTLSFLFMFYRILQIFCCGSIFIMTTRDGPLKVELYLSVSRRHTGEWRYSSTHS